MRQLRFVPYHELRDTPNVIVDGGPTESTRLTLSHWPGSPTPVDLLHDLSAQIAFHALDNALDDSTLFDGIAAVSNNHFDQDGLASAFVLVHPDAALARRDLVIDVARAGDFATFRNRDAIRIAFALAVLADPVRSPLDPALLAGDDDHQCGRLYEYMLPRFCELLDNPDSVRPLWEAEDAHLTETLAAIAGGEITITERAALDLATVSIPEDWAERVTTRFAISRSEPAHPAALNQSTTCMRLLLVQGRRYRVELRYETWVMYRSRPVMPRPDLRVLATALNDLEPAGAMWTATAPGALTPVLRLVDVDSGIPPEEFRGHVERFLVHAPAAWDPYTRR